MIGIFSKKNREIRLHVCLLVIIVFIAYSKLFHAGFMTWDDNEYVVHNNDIKGFTAENISAWFSHYYIGNYHPLTIFSYAIDYLIGGDGALIYHVTNILLHACNAVFLYFIVKGIGQKSIVAFFVAALFALHPVQTESVSWIAERKTVLCAFFYLLALLQYAAYIKKPSAKKIAFVFVLGIAAMLSKAVGVALPAALLAMDIWMQRDIKKIKLWLEKVPFILAGLIIGLVAIKAQAAGKFLGLHPEYNWFDTVIFAGYAYVQYMIQLFVPVHLSVIYPYPEHIGFMQYLYLAIAAGIIGLGFIAYRKRWYVLCGGILFYTANIVLLLQFVQFGEFLMADRYLYIAGIGILIPAVAYLFAWLQQRSKQLIGVVAGSCIVLACMFATFLRNDIWLSDFDFFTAVLETFPNSAVAQYSVGGLYMRMGDYTESQKHIDLAVQLDPGNYKAWYNKGALALRQHKPAEALDALNRCLAINEYPKAYFSRALLYQETGKPELALSDIEIVLADQPRNARAYFIKAGCMEQLGKAPEAIDNYSKAIAYDSKDPLFYIRRGLLYGKTRQNEPAISDLNTAVELSPANGEAYYFRGIIKYHAGQSACDDFKSAMYYGYKQAQEAIDKTCR